MRRRQQCRPPELSHARIPVGLVLLGGGAVSGPDGSDRGVCCVFRVEKDNNLQTFRLDREHLSGWMFKAVVQKEDGPPPQSPFFCSLQQVFFSWWDPVSGSIPTSPSCFTFPAKHVHPHSMILPPPCWCSG
ncbi:hypothetical protein ATANTOWER_005892 [Ataeniobius toweri]|uniref:Uncharacterized protein n=1 Tax=Ataeniobius toweri TaxID=208326 RepID=A0ABU7BBN8_9TELE|nr:hypothetical protein [Ataeniobius toweri]